MDLLGSNPFTVFTLITAPAVMTNASAIMSLTTSNRLGRAVDRSRALLDELGRKAAPLTLDQREDVIRRVEMTRRRAVLLIRALGAFQLAYGSFAASTLVALIGAVLGLVEPKVLSHAALLLSLVCLVVAIGGLITGASTVVFETRIAYRHLVAEAQQQLGHLSHPPDPPP